MKEASDYPIGRADLEGSSVEEQLTYQWMILNDKVVNEMRGDPRYRLIRYEDLCRDPDQVTRELFQFVGLHRSTQTTAFVGHLRSKRGQPMSYFSVMRSPGESADRWRQQLNQEQIDKVLSIYSHSQIRRLGFGW
jgi:hypothetical protein